MPWRPPRWMIVVTLVVFTCLALVFAYWAAQHLRGQAVEHVIAAQLPRPGLPQLHPGDGDMVHPELSPTFSNWLTRVGTAHYFGFAPEVRADADPAVRHAAIVARLAADAPLLDELHDLLQRGLRPSIPETAYFDWGTTWFRLECAARDWRLAASVATDPKTALDDLDLLMVRLVPTLSLHAIEAAAVVANIRDLAYFDTIRSGTIAPERRQWWISKPGYGSGTEMLLALEMERLWLAPMRARSTTGLDPKAFWKFHRSTYPDSDPNETIAAWWSPEHLLADDLARLSRAEDCFDPASASASATAASTWQDDTPGNLFLPENLNVVARIVLDARTHHRQLLTEVRVLDLAVQTGALPDHLPSDFDLAGGRDRLPLRYLHRDARHFAIVEATADPARPAYAIPPSPNRDPVETSWLEIGSATSAEPAGP